MKKKVIELIRVSTEGQARDDRGGIPAQRAANLRTAQAYGLEIVRTFEIADVSGARVLSCPEMQELLALIESPEIAGVVTREFSRLMRPEDWGDFVILQRFAESNAILFLPDGPVDLSTKSGKLFGGIRALMAGYERHEIRERLESAKEAIRRAGRHAGGSKTLPFGVTWDKSNGWQYTPEAEKVKYAFHQVLTTGRPYAEIAAELGLPRTNLRCILQNPIWIGYRRYDKKRDRAAAAYVPGENGRQGYRRKIAREDSEIIEVKVFEQPLVAPNVFHRVQEILADRAARQRQTRSANGPRYEFNGFLSCAICGSPLYTHSSKDRYYICKLNNPRERQKGHSCRNPYILASKTESKIVEVLASRIQSKRSIRQIAEMYCADLQQPHGASSVDVQASKTLLAGLQAKRARVMDAFFDGSISKPERDKRIKAIDSELAGISARLEKATAPAAPPVTAQQIADLLHVVFSQFKRLDRDDRRAILAASRARVFMDSYTIDRLELDAPFAIEQPAKASDNGGGIGSHLPVAAIVTTPRIVISVGW